MSDSASVLSCSKAELEQITDHRSQDTVPSTSRRLSLEENIITLPLYHRKSNADTVDHVCYGAMLIGQKDFTLT